MQPPATGLPSVDIGYLNPQDTQYRKFFDKWESGTYSDRKPELSVTEIIKTLAF